MDGVRNCRWPSRHTGNLRLLECLAALFFRSLTRAPARACPRFMSYSSTKELIGLCIFTDYDALVSSQDGTVPGCHLTLRRPTFLPMNIELNAPNLCRIEVQVKETESARPKLDMVDLSPCFPLVYLPGTCQRKSIYSYCRPLIDICSSVSIPSLARSGKRSSALGPGTGPPANEHS